METLITESNVPKKELLSEMFEVNQKLKKRTPIHMKQTITLDQSLRNYK